MSQERHDRQRRLWGVEGQALLQDATVLLAGAGGLGSEVGKNLALLGVKRITIVDLDKIELSNLNRHVFFSEKHVGKYKAEVLAQALEQLNPNVEISFHNKMIQVLSKDPFSSADYFISALDNIAARIFLNNTAVHLQKPMIDGGAEGFIGHVQVVLPRSTPCLACHNLWTPQTEPFKCTYAIIPRTPLDCALEARDKFFISHDRLPSVDDPGDLEEVYNLALAHAQNHDIVGVTRENVKHGLRGTVAQIITTNAIVGAIMVNEFTKIVLRNTVKFEELSLKIQDFLQFNGTTGQCWSVPLKRNQNCSICGKSIFTMEIPPDLLLIQFLESLNSVVGTPLLHPMILRDKYLIYRKSKTEQNAAQKNEYKSLGELFQDNDVLYVKDEATGLDFRTRLKFKG